MLNWNSDDNIHTANSGEIELVVVENHINYPDSIVGYVKPFEKRAKKLDSENLDAAKGEVKEKAVSILTESLRQLDRGEDLSFEEARENLQEAAKKFYLSGAKTKDLRRATRMNMVLEGEERIEALRSRNE